MMSCSVMAHLLFSYGLPLLNQHAKQWSTPCRCVCLLSARRPPQCKDCLGAVWFTRGFAFRLGQDRLVWYVCRCESAAGPARWTAAYICIEWASTLFSCWKERVTMAFH